MRRTLAIDEANLGSEHPEAEPQLRRALSITESSFGTDPSGRRRASQQLRHEA